MPLSGVGELASLTITRSIRRGVMSTLASSEAETGLPASSVPLAVTVLTCEVPPASSRNVAVRELRLPDEFASLQEIDVRLHPWASASVEVYVPGARPVTTIWPLSPIEPAASPLKLKLPAALFGLVCFSTRIVPSFVFVKTHVTVSPASRSTASGSDSSEHSADSRSQPCGTFSDTAYVPGTRSPEMFD